MIGPSTLLTHRGRNDREPVSFVNPPVCRGSTVLFPDLETMVGGRERYGYGRHGNPTASALISILKELDGPRAACTVLTPSGLSAISTALLSVLRPGHHLLVTDSAYGPTRELCTGFLKRLGVDVTFFDPLLGSSVADLMRATTRAVYLESPGSQTFEIQDVPEIVRVAHERGAKVLMDNSWATPLNFRPLDHGVDLAIQSATKYVVGHSDALMGVITAGAACGESLSETYRLLGLCVGPDDAYLALRGLRTMAVRLRQHQESALRIARWLECQRGVTQVLHPALPTHPGHAIWKRDFGGSTGLFSIVTEPAPFQAVASMLNGLRHFGIGLSFGGYESLATWIDPRPLRTAKRWTDAGHLVRLQIGLEDCDDLIADLSDGFERFRSASAKAA